MFSHRRQLRRSSKSRARSKQWRPTTATIAWRSGRSRRPRRSLSPGWDEGHLPIQLSRLLRPRSSIQLLHPGAVNGAAAATHRLQPFPEFFGVRAGIDTVPNEPCFDEDNDLGPRLGVRCVSKQVAEKLDFAKSRNARLCLLIAFADETGE